MKEVIKRKRKGNVRRKRKEGGKVRQGKGSRKQSIGKKIVKKESEDGKKNGILSLK